MSPVFAWPVGHSSQAVTNGYRKKLDESQLYYGDRLTILKLLKHNSDHTVHTAHTAIELSIKLSSQSACGFRQEESLFDKAFPEFFVKPAYPLDFVDKPVVQASPRFSVAGEVLSHETGDLQRCSVDTDD